MSFWNKKESSENTAAPSNATANPTATENVELASSQASGGATRVRSALGAGTVVQGKLSFDTSVQIDGKLLGEVYSSRTLVVGKTGSVDAVINVATLVVEGQINGRIVARERVEVRPGGVLCGEVSTPLLVVDQGGILQATCNMSQSSRATSEAASGGAKSLAQTGVAAAV